MSLDFTQIMLDLWSRGLTTSHTKLLSSADCLQTGKQKHFNIQPTARSFDPSGIHKSCTSLLGWGGGVK